MDDEAVRQHIAAEVRAEMARQHKRPTDVAALLEKSRQAYSRQYYGKGGYRVKELIAIADWLGVDVKQFLPRGYVMRVVEYREPIAS